MVVAILQQAAPCSSKCITRFFGLVQCAVEIGRQRVRRKHQGNSRRLTSDQPPQCGLTIASRLKEMLPAGGVFIGCRSEAHMVRIDPFRMHTEIILQRGENRIGLVDAEGTANRQVPQGGIRKFDLYV